MKLNILIVRHAESTDNVKGIYAGTLDAPLTSHGVLQATRLATTLSHTATLTANGLLRTLYTSPLRRTTLTAHHLATPFFSPPTITSPLLSERNFGALEGASYRAKQTVKLADTAEPPEAVAARAMEFVGEVLGRLVKGYAQVLTDRGTPDEDRVSVAIVSHGVIIKDIAKAIDEIYGERRYAEVFRKAGSLNNTGYIHFCLDIADGPVAPGEERRIDLTLVSANNEEHLKGLVKTKGGIGSAAHDSKQQTLDSFFRRR